MLGAFNLPAMTTYASQLFSRNMLTLLQHLLTQDGALVIDLADEMNDSFAEADVAVVIGANDAVNPAAKTDPSGPGLTA